MSDTGKANMKSLRVNIHTYSIDKEGCVVCIINPIDSQELSFLESKREASTEKETKNEALSKYMIDNNLAIPDQADTASITTSSSTGSSTEEKFAKEIKNGMRDKTVSRSVRALQLMSILVGIILIIMTCNF